MKSDKLTNSKFRDVDLNFDVRNGRVFVEPFDTKLGNADVTIAGDQGIDQTMNYTMNFSIPRSEFGNSANDLLEDFAAQAQSKGFDLNPGDDVNVQLKIKGSFSDPEISMDLKENMANLKTEMKQAVQQKVEQEVEKVKEDVRENVSEEIDKIMADAEKEADNIRKKADEAADALVGEAELRKKQLIDEAGNNPLKKIVAEKTGDELVKKAEQQAQKLRDEADKKANNLLEKAKERAESLKNR